MGGLPRSPVAGTHRIWNGPGRWVFLVRAPRAPLAVRSRSPRVDASGGTCYTPAMLWLRILAVVFTGTTQALIAPPLSWTPLHWISWVPLLWALDGVGGKRRFWLGWLGGFSALLAIFYWIVGTVQKFSNLPLSLGIAVLILFAAAWGLYLGVFAVAYPWVKRWAGPAWPFAVAALLVATEFANPQLFPFYQGVAHYENLALFQVVSLTGVRGMSFLVLVVNGLVWAALEALWLRRGPVRPRQLPVLAGIVAAVFAAVLVYGAVRLRHIDRLEQDAPTVRVGLIQIGMGIEDRSRRIRQNRYGILREYMEESRNAAEEGAQVAVWPEGASPYRVEGRRGREIGSVCKDADIEIWTGALTRVTDEQHGRHYRNSAFRFDRQGQRHGPYDKIILLPFGEFMPLRHVLPGLTQKIEGVGNFYPGEDVVVFDSPWGPFNFLICYEAIRSKLVRRNVRAGSRLFVTITNDAWFGDTSCPSQHLMLTANRCAEYGIPMVRSATTGISAHVDARGDLVVQTEPYTKDIVVAEVSLAHAPTPYTRIGDAFSWICVAIAVVGAGLGWRRLRQERAADPEVAPDGKAEPPRKGRARGRKKKGKRRKS